LSASILEKRKMTEQEREPLPTIERHGSLLFVSF